MSEEASRPVKQRLLKIIDLLNNLKVSKEESADGKFSIGRGIWLSPTLWREVTKQLESQVQEILEWEQLLVSTTKEANQERFVAQELEEALKKTHELASNQLADLECTIQGLEAQGKIKEQQFVAQKAEMQGQIDHTLGLLKDRAGVAAANVQLHEQANAAAEQLVKLEARAQEAEAKVSELQARLDYVVDKTGDSQVQRDELQSKVRRLEIALVEATSSNEVMRSQLASRQDPAVEMLRESKRLKADNERLVAMLADTKEWRSIAAEMAAERGLHYIPVQESLYLKGLTEVEYTPLLDRPLRLNIRRKGAASAGRAATAKKRGITAAAAAAVDGGQASSGDRTEDVEASPEQWHWVPQQAVDVTVRAIAQAMPTAPMPALLHLLLEINKVWRKREADAMSAMKALHEDEIRELHELYRQRAPYETAVGRTRLVDLKRQLKLQVEHAKVLAASADKDAKDRIDDTKVTLQLGLDSVSTLSKEVKKLASKNNKLSKSLDMHKRRPPICTVCLENMLLPPPPPRGPSIGKLDADGDAAGGTAVAHGAGATSRQGAAGPPPLPEDAAAGEAVWRSRHASLMPAGHNSSHIPAVNMPQLLNNSIAAPAGPSTRTRRPDSQQRQPLQEPTLEYLEPTPPHPEATVERVLSLSGDQPSRSYQYLRGVADAQHRDLIDLCTRATNPSEAPPPLSHDSYMRRVVAPVPANNAADSLDARWSQHAATATAQKPMWPQELQKRLQGIVP
ncbi:hypothetical protein CEUSTIGMA_g5381.t1 [Chlamydomonas eustigma]|uniref:Uncharacterized protein n=1 Tax=Chlamydomonas eustigma TaxID=1157962 RepID=A0A250X4U5_9CHLO|nr:hypothetical protein CEUSTIGMA_g5381.t1 [Chlamydomonas eustigma]|eukprot:GAX77939.1 hypothetical protein CEUSTIGMA_g5381.t1 [Chlamydomonas eustigma]